MYPIVEEQRLLRRALLACLPRMPPQELARSLNGWGMCLVRAGWDRDPQLDGQLAAGFERELRQHLPSMDALEARTCMFGWARTGFPLSPELAATMRAAMLRMLQPEAAGADPQGAVRALTFWFALRCPLDGELAAAAEAALVSAVPRLEEAVDVEAISKLLERGRLLPGLGWSFGPEVAAAVAAKRAELGG